MLLLTISITIRGHNDYYVAKPTLALIDVNPNHTINRNLTSISYGIKSDSDLSYPWKQIESGVKVSESTDTSLPFKDPLSMPTHAGFEIVSEETQFKPHIHISVNNNNPSSANSTAAQAPTPSQSNSTAAQAPVQKLSIAAAPINRTAPGRQG